MKNYFFAVATLVVFFVGCAVYRYFESKVKDTWVTVIIKIVAALILFVAFAVGATSVAKLLGI